MLLKSVLVLCIVWSSGSGFRLAPSRLRFYDDLLSRQVSELPPVETQKEYGAESRKYTHSKSFYVSNNKLSWDDARIACKERGMILAIPKTKADARDLEMYLRENSLVPKDQYSGYWIGGRRLTGDFYAWDSSGDLVDDGWLPGEPNGYLGEDCVEYKKEIYSIMGFNNYYCSELRRYICEHASPAQEWIKNIVESPKDTVHEEIAKFKESEIIEDDSGSLESHTEARDNVYHRELTTTEEAVISTTEYPNFYYMSTQFPEEEPLSNEGNGMKTAVRDNAYLHRFLTNRREQITEKAESSRTEYPYFYYMSTQFPEEEPLSDEGNNMEREARLNLYRLDLDRFLMKRREQTTEEAASSTTESHISEFTKIPVYIRHPYHPIVQPDLQDFDTDSVLHPFPDNVDEKIDLLPEDNDDYYYQ